MMYQNNIMLSEYPLFHSSNLINFHGKIIQSKDITLENFTAQNIAIIGTDQNTVTHLSKICHSAHSVTVFQINPLHILPKTDKIFQRLIHPLFTKNRRLINQRIKALISLQFLENNVINHWLKKQLSPNIAKIPKFFLRSDDYYTALQSENCQLVTWPIQKVLKNQLICIDNSSYPTDIIILSEPKADQKVSKQFK